MANILLLYSTNYGLSKKICETIQASLRAKGQQAEVQPLVGHGVEPAAFGPIDVGHDPKSDPAIHLLKKSHAPGLSTDPVSICTGSNSGYQAINIATLAGAKRVILFGYDCRASGGKHHFFGDHPDKSFAPYDVIRAKFPEAVEPARAIGCEILNATPGSHIECFPKVDLAESLQPHT